jgi:alpha-tubulin suppressor-like RCC1 family protein
VSENQIEIKSKHQENIQEEIFAKQELKSEEIKSPLEPRQGEYTEVYVWGDDSQGQLGLELFNKKKEQVKSYYNIPKSCSFNVVIAQASCG